MVLFRRAIVLFFIIPPAFAAPVKWKASDLARVVVEKNPTLQGSKLGWEITQIDKKNRFYSFFPNLVFQTSGGLDAQTQVQQGNPWVSQYTFKLTDTLWSPTNNWWTYKEGTLNEKFAELSFRQSRDQILLTLVKNVCTYLDLSFQLQIAREVLKYVQTEFSIIQSSYRQGLKSYSDFLRFKGQLLNQQLVVQNLEISVKKSLVDVATVVEMREEIGDVEDDMLLLAKPTDEMKRMNQLLVDELIRYQKELADVRVEIAKQLYPFQFNVSLGVNYSQQQYLPNQTPITPTGPLESFGLVTFTLQLWDWGAGRRAIQTARLTQEQLVFGQQSAQTQAISRFQQLVVDMTNLENQQRALNEIVKVGDESLKQQTINYRNGKSTFLDYSAALTELGNSKQSLHGSQLQLKKLRAEALSLKGRLYENLISQ